MSNSPYTPPLPDLPELPRLENTGAEAIRLRGTLAKALPPMPGGQLEDLYGSNYRAVAQAIEARDIGIANEYTKAYNQRSAARARARNRMKTKYVENASRRAYKGNKRLAGNTNREAKAATRWFAREVLGVGPDLYR